MTSKKIENSLLPAGEADDKVLSIIQAEGLTDYTIEMSSGAEKGDNFTGMIVHTDIKGTAKDGEAKELHLLTKCSPRIGDFRNLMPIVAFYRLETFMYRDYFHTLYNLVEQNGIELETKLFSVPKMYEFSTELMDEFIIMDNKKYANYRLANRFLPLPEDHCHLVLKQMGYLHGLGYVLKHRYAETFEKFMETFRENVMEKFTMEVGTVMYKGHVESSVKRAAEVLDPKTEQDVIERLHEFSKIAFDQYLWDLIINADKFDTKYSVVIHGDCWTNNFLFKYDEAGKLTDDMCMIDFQMSRISSPVIELLYFMAVSVSIEMRKNQFQEMLRIYYTALSEIVQKFNLEPDHILPWSILEADIKKYGAYMIVCGVQALALHTSNKDDIPDFQTMTMDNAADVMALTAKCSANELFIKRLRGLILFVVEQGFL